MVKWEPKYETGLAVIDDQHRELFKLAAELEHAINVEEKLDCEYMMARLEVYSLYHFTSEEHLMQKYGYPDIEEHKQKHHKFRMKILGMKENCLDTHGAACRQELLDYLEEWIQTHIIEVDHKYLPYLQKGMGR